MAGRGGRGDGERVAQRKPIPGVGEASVPVEMPVALTLRRRKGGDGPQGSIVRPRPSPTLTSLLVDVAMEGMLQKRVDTRMLFHPLAPRYFVLLLGQIQELRYYHRVLETRFGNCPVGAATSIPLESIVGVEVPARGPTPSTFILTVSRVKGTRYPRSAILGTVTDGWSPAQLSDDKATRLRAGGAVEPSADEDRRAGGVGAISTVVSETRSFTLSAPSVDARARWVDAIRDACPQVRVPGDA